MSKKELFSSENYISPEVKIYAVRAQRVICDSVNGVQSFSDDADSEDYGEY